MKSVKVCLVAAIVLLTGCDSGKQFIPEVIPEGLRDCQFYNMRINGTQMMVTRCPNSSTSTTTGGKHKKHNTVIDG